LNLKQIIAKYVTGSLPTEQIPQIGITALKEGFETPTLWILAGLDKNEDSYVMERYLKLALQELNITMPNKRHAALEYACAIADEIIDDQKDLITGVEELRNKAIDSFDFWSENINYVYDSISFEKVYGLYVDYDDLWDTHLPNIPFKSNNELMAETKVQLLEELKKWVEKTKLIL
jgi:hypothetical protein